MRLDYYIEEDNNIEILTSWEYQNQLYGFKSLEEMFDKEIEFGNIRKSKDLFMVNFKAADAEWVFKSTRLSDDIYGILFNKVGDKPEDMFNSKSNKEYVGEVFAGVFRCIKKLVDDRNVNGIAFKSIDSKLLSLYNRMSKWVIKRFPDFIFQKELHKKNPTEFVYMKKGVELDETIVAGDVAKNTAKGHVPVIGAARRIKKKKKKSKLTGLMR